MPSFHTILDVSSTRGDLGYNFIRTHTDCCSELPKYYPALKSQRVLDFPPCGMSTGVFWGLSPSDRGSFPRTLWGYSAYIQVAVLPSPLNPSPPPRNFPAPPPPIPLVWISTTRLHDGAEERRMTVCYSVHGLLHNIPPPQQ